MGHSTITVSQRYVHPSPRGCRIGVWEIGGAESAKGGHKCWHIRAARKTGNSVNSIVSTCPGGEIGRRNGLKIRFSARRVRVQFPPRAPLICRLATGPTRSRRIWRATPEASRPRMRRLSGVTRGHDPVARPVHQLVPVPRPGSISMRVRSKWTVSGQGGSILVPNRAFGTFCSPKGMKFITSNLRARTII
jgi:hypothetical protein